MTPPYPILEHDEAREALIDPAHLGRMSEDPLWLFREHWHPELPIVRRLQMLDLHGG